jgi:hypothetical protein
VALHEKLGFGEAALDQRLVVGEVPPGSRVDQILVDVPRQAVEGFGRRRRCGGGQGSGGEERERNPATPGGRPAHRVLPPNLLPRETASAPSRATRP